ncbi:MAG TPA: sialidase family protein, partial [Blastocatellia bacterium]
MKQNLVGPGVCLLAALMAWGAVPAAAQKTKQKASPKQEEPAASMNPAASPENAAPPEHDKWLPKQMKWRGVGPANMGGRVADFDVDPKNPYTIYVATATGGLLKSKDNGTTWTGIFEHESVASTGAVAVSPSDSKTIWLGTGEPNGRNSSSWGNGVYKSTDGGGTWANMGLKDSQDIARIVIDPSDSNLVYVAALGHLWGPNKERGVFKTTDGGKTWSASLQIDEN